MAHTYTHQLFHIVFSTQGRLPLITKGVQEELYRYIGGLAKELKGRLIAIGGMADHLHVLIELPPSVSTSDAMRFIKANSSRWITQRYGKPFAWQKGFGSFTVSRSGVDAVVAYIENQEEHHARRDFREEFVRMLRNNGVEYDENFLWK